ncbi:hypothetical protein [Paractinoplanes toevensis]|uniref:Uncharacterized protein n=1 Tax=Paractinoplanes toevensis TaxID=571911 RepID=A0A919T6F5_9ACTN|nr:hypothetical protein [Actinoplanes toevensis]GIM89557.1 hypothetical protein Ato02nite_013500 [Actinoplanes toevensis]
MSRRFRGFLPLALITVTALAAGCDDQATPTAAAPATSATTAAAPATSATPAGPTRNEVCTEVTKVVIDGSVQIADNAVKSIDERWSTKEVNDHLRTSFGDMAKKVRAQAEAVADPELKAAVEKTAAELAQGAKSSKPDDFLAKDFQTLSKDLDKACGA